MAEYHHNNSIMVKNVNGTSKPPYKDNNLKRHYREAGGTVTDDCQVMLPRLKQNIFNQLIKGKG